MMELPSIGLSWRHYKAWQGINCLCAFNYQSRSLVSSCRLPYSYIHYCVGQIQSSRLSGSHTSLPYLLCTVSFLLLYRISQSAFHISILACRVHNLGMCISDSQGIPAPSLIMMETWPWAGNGGTLNYIVSLSFLVLPFKISKLCFYHSSSRFLILYTEQSPELARTRASCTPRSFPWLWPSSRSLLLHLLPLKLWQRSRILYMYRRLQLQVLPQTHPLRF